MRAEPGWSWTNEVTTNTLQELDQLHLLPGPGGGQLSHLSEPPDPGVSLSLPGLPPPRPRHLPLLHSNQAHTGHGIAH